MKENWKHLCRQKITLYHLESLVADENRASRFPLVYSGNVFRFITAYIIDCCKYEFAHTDNIYICIKLNWIELNWIESASM
jgi:hypothetical protein